VKRIFLSLLLVLIAACASGPQPGSSSAPGHGAIAVAVEPNPIHATRVSGNTYDFPFEVVVRETGGRRIDIERVSMIVYGPGRIALGNESWDANRIRSLGYPTSLGPRSELRYRFSPRREVPDDRLFSGVSAQLTVDAVDDTSTPTSASTVVTTRR
jgi:hypothetical protein